MDEGRLILIDDRGRLYVPAWLRRPPVASLLVGTNRAASTVLIASISVFDGLGDRLVGEDQ